MKEKISKQRLKDIVSGSIGNLVEWYDWYAYSAFALYFSVVFFPKQSPTAQLLNTAGIFAVGFLMRPLGGWLFGMIADRTGRKRAMTLSVLLMSFGSLIIALTPGYNSIGVLAPVLLLFARLLQGLSVGGEYGVSATYLSEMASKGSLKKLFQYPKALLTVVGLTLGGTIAFYTYTTYMQKFLVNTVHLSKEQSTLISFLTLFLFACLQPFFGALSDRIGRKPLLIGFGVLGTICTYPLLSTLSVTNSPLGAFFLLLGALIIISGYTSINAIVKAELFPAEIRALGVGFPYAFTVALFGGTAEYIALWFKNSGHEHYFYWYVTACVFASLVIYVTMRDTKANSKMDKE